MHRGVVCPSNGGRATAGKMMTLYGGTVWWRVLKTPGVVHQVGGVRYDTWPSSRVFAPPDDSALNRMR